MKNHKERLEWILRFVEMDLDHLRAGDSLNLQEDLRDLLGWSSFREIPLEGVRPLQEETKAILLNLIRANAPQATMTQNTQPDLQTRGARRGFRRPVRKTDSVALTYTTEEGTRRYLDIPVKTIEHLYFDFSNPGQPEYRIKADLRGEFVFLLGTTLSRVDMTYLRQCPVCARLFFAEHGRQHFCTPKCANRAGARRFREKHREEEAERERNNNEKRIKGRRGPKVPISRRMKSTLN